MDVIYRIAECGRERQCIISGKQRKSWSYAPTTHAVVWLQLLILLITSDNRNKRKYVE